VLVWLNQQPPFIILETTSRGTTGLEDMLCDNEVGNGDQDLVIDRGQLIRVERPILEPPLEDLVDRGNSLTAGAEDQQCMQHLHNAIGSLKRLNGGWCTK
jgi:hypothetical protein